MPENLSSSRLTLDWFFCDDGDASVTEALTPDARENTLAPLSDAFDAAPGVERKILSQEVFEQLKTLLDVDLGQIILSSWERYRLLSKYGDREAYPPEETILVPMIEHKIQSTHRPSVEILINEAPVGRLDFDIRLTLKLEGVVLKVRDGRVREIRAGSCRGSGTLRCGDILIKEQKTRKFDLPGRIDLGEGFAIPRA